jgi:general secretion pathway protein J
MRRADRTQEAGFSLIEALVAMALLGTVMAGLATVTAQWLPNWSRGFTSVQRNELLERGVERLIADLASAEYVPLGSGDSPHPLFTGSALSVTFVRRALGPNTKPGLEIVRIAETAGRRGAVLVRTRARFAPAGPDASDNQLPPLRDPVVLLRVPYRVSFSYAGRDRKWRNAWQDAERLPRAVRVLVRDSATDQVLPVSTAVALHVDGPPACQKGGKAEGCSDSAPTGADTPSAAENNAAGNNTAEQP